MRIAFDHQAFTRQRYGGVTRYYFHLINCLSYNNRNQVGVFAPFHINEYIKTLPTSLLQGKFINRYPFKLKPLFRYFNTYTARPLIARWKPDVIHETYFSPVRTGPIDVPSVVTVYDMTHELYPGEFYSWDRTSVHKKKAVDRAKHIICISESTRNDLVEIFNIPKEKIDVIYLAYEDRSLVDSNQTRYRFNTTDRPFILFVGHRNGYKNFSRFLIAVSTSTEISKQFDVICFGGSPFTHNEEKLIKKLGLIDSIKYVGGGDDVLNELYKSASALIYPSLYEGFGLPLLEAMFHNCPVICSNTSSLPEVADDAAEYFDPVDENSIVGALKNVLLSQDRHNELVHKGKDRLQFFSWEKCAKQTLQIYEKIS